MASGCESTLGCKQLIPAFRLTACPLPCPLPPAQLPIAMLACARIGAVHSVVFGGFSSDALASRIEDCKARVLITCNGERVVGTMCALSSSGKHCPA